MENNELKITMPLKRYEELIKYEYEYFKQLKGYPHIVLYRFYGKTEETIAYKDEEALNKIKEIVKNLLDEYYIVYRHPKEVKVEPKKTWIAKIFGL
jgi:hypothetical protein